MNSDVFYKEIIFIQLCLVVRMNSEVFYKEIIFIQH